LFLATVQFAYYSAQSKALAKYWIYVMGEFCVHTFGYNSAKSEPIWIKTGAFLSTQFGGWPWHILGEIHAVTTV